MTFWQYVAAHAVGGLIEFGVLFLIFKSHKIHIGKDSVEL
jgi:hypothetical protein